MTDAQPIHLHPTAPLASRALLPGDPGRALSLAQWLLEEPRMFNHNRGLWGYTGAARSDGEPLTIQSTGMGGPSAAIVLQELIELGVKRAIRVGTCGALAPSLGLGELVIARESLATDGTSKALGAGKKISADALLTTALEAQAPASSAGTIVSSDLFYEAAPTGAHEWIAEGALAIEMEAAALFTLGARFEVPIACMLIVSDVFSSTGERVRIDPEALLEAGEKLGWIALAALPVELDSGA